MDLFLDRSLEVISSGPDLIDLAVTRFLPEVDHGLDVFLQGEWVASLVAAFLFFLLDLVLQPTGEMTPSSHLEGPELCAFGFFWHGHEVVLIEFKHLHPLGATPEFEIVDFSLVLT